MRLEEGHLGMVILYPMFFQYVIHLSGGWTVVLISMCVDISLFTSFQVGRTGALLMGNGSRAHVHGVGSVILKLTSGKMVLLKHM
jgi:hypothetical protein